jgi:signal transduction histidine kinase/DNA-binding response OmpR family regulator
MNQADGVSRCTRMTFHVAFLLLWLVAGSTPAVAETRVPMPSVEPGPSWSIRDFTQDSLGEGRYISTATVAQDRTVWIATWDGIRRYDGYQWTHMGMTNGLPSNLVRHILVRRNGEVWVGTDQGVGVLKDGRFEARSQSGNLAGDSVRRIAEAPDGTLWFASEPWPRSTAGGGLTRLRNGIWTRYGTADGLPTNYVFEIFVSSNGRVLAGTPKGVVEFDNERWKPIPLPGSGLFAPRAFTEDWTGRILITADSRIWQSEGKLWKPLTTRILRSDQNGKWSPDPSLQILHLASRDSEGRVLVLVGGGEKEPRSPDRFLAQLDGENLRVVTPPIGRRDWQWVEHLTPTPEGGFWIVGQDLAMRWDRNGGEWQRLRKSLNTAAVDRRDRLWFHEDGQLSRLEGSERVIWGEAGQSVVPDADGELWAWGLGDVVQNTGTPTIRWTSADTGLPKPELGVIDTTNRLWLGGTSSNGTVRLSRHHKGRWSHEAIPKSEGYKLLGLDSDRQGGVWAFAALDRSAILYHSNGHSNRVVEVPDLDWLWEPRMSTDLEGAPYIYRTTTVHKFEPGTGQFIRIHELPGWGQHALHVGGLFGFLMQSRLGGITGVALLREGRWQISNLGWREEELSASSLQHRSPTAAPLPIIAARNIHFVQVDDTRISRVRLPEPVVPWRVAGLLNGEVWVNGDNGTLRYRPDGIPPKILGLDASQRIIVGSRLQGTPEVAQFNRPRSERRDVYFSWRFDNGPWTPFGPWPQAGFDLTSLKPGKHRLEVRCMDESGDVATTAAFHVFDLIPIPLQARPAFLPTVIALGLLMTGLAGYSWQVRRRIAGENARLDGQVRIRTADLELALKEEQRLAAAATDASRTKDAFLANMSHEIRTPLNGILGMNDLLLDTRLNEDQRLYASSVRTSTEALLAIINDLLDVAKIESGTLRIDDIEFDPRPTIDGVLELCAPRARTIGLELTCLIHRGLPSRLRGDPNRIRQILLNLVGNALKFTERGSIHVEVNVITKSTPAWRIEVRDTGIGISAETIPRLFRPFTQADVSTTRRYGGTGLGLAISKRFVELMGGTIGVGSTPGHGSTFWFELPLRVAAGVDETSVFAGPSSGPVRTLIVDQHENTRRILTHYAGACGVQADTEASSLEATRLAIAKARQSGNPFVLLLLGHLGETASPRALARQLREEGIVVAERLVVAQWPGESASPGALLAAGVAAAVPKPIQLDALTRAIEIALGVRSTSDIIEPESQFPDARDLVGLRVLLAEDHPVNRLYAETLLTKLGCLCDAVADGTSVLVALARNTYDVVLMDCQMPGMDGYEATRRIRASSQSWSRIQVIALTANAMPGARAECLASGMNEHIEKPIDPAHLIRLLRATLKSTEPTTPPEPSLPAAPSLS